jgi:hypothetical protein
VTLYYCTECAWSIRANDERSRDECNTRAIQHYCETEHTVVRRTADRRTLESRAVLGEDRL